MKKIKLKLDGIKEMLTKEQMKKVTGGYDNNTFFCRCSNAPNHEFVLEASSCSAANSYVNYYPPAYGGCWDYSDPTVTGHCVGWSQPCY